jgi:tetratricopeptide (TPR) repeat protein
LKTLLGAGLFLIVLGISLPAAAEDKAAARQAYLEGSKYYDLSQYAEALEAFKRAYWNFEDPSILFNIAQCDRALGHKKEAVDFYRSYLRKAPDASNRQDVEKIIAELNRTIDKEKAVSTAPPIATEKHSAPPPDSAPAAPRSAPPSAANHALTTPAPTRTEKPIWKRGWLWGVLGGVVVAGVAVGLGVGLGSAHPPNASYGAVAF